MSGWSILGIIVAVLVVALVVMNAKDLYRYIKINMM